MRPCTLHYVITTDNSTALGRYFYASSSIADSCFGLVHAMFCDDGVTNASNDHTHTIIRRIFSYWYQFYVEDQEMLNTAHIPDITQQEGLLDMIYVRNILELSKFLDHHKGPLSKEEKDEAQIAIWRYRNLQLVFADQYCVNVDNEPICPQSIFERSLVEFISAMVIYIQTKVLEDNQKARITEIMDYFGVEFPHLLEPLEMSISEGQSDLEWGGPDFDIIPRDHASKVGTERWNFKNMVFRENEPDVESEDESPGMFIILHLFNCY